MDEAQWLSVRDHPQGMTWPLRDRFNLQRTKAGRRKHRLVACGCCRLIWEHLDPPILRQAVEMAERFADGEATASELAGIRESVQMLGMGGYSPNDAGVQPRTAAALSTTTTHPKPQSAAFGVTSFPVPLAGYRGTPLEAKGLICDIFRDIFGNPFRPVTFEPAWRTSTVLDLARQMYESREFYAMPILADALQDAGCENEDVLTHCRDPKGVHVRGCWVVDLVLGKS